MSMTPYYQTDGITIYHGDCREVLPMLDPVETCLTDPPYGLEFMGKGWDKGVPGVEFWEAVRGALLPGAMLLAFGGTRTYHRLACAIEDAGFELRDCLMWVYGSGFPKSRDISKAIDEEAEAEREVVGKNPTYRKDQVNSSSFTLQRNPNITAPATDAAKLWNGWGSSLKPAYEPILLAMKPLDGTFANNAQVHGVAGLNIDGGRVGTEVRFNPPTSKDKTPALGSFAMCDGKGLTVQGRWPANLILTYPEDSYMLRDDVTPKQLRVLAEWMDENP